EAAQADHPAPAPGPSRAARAGGSLPGRRSSRGRRRGWRAQVHEGGSRAGAFGGERRQRTTGLNTRPQWSTPTRARHASPLRELEAVALTVLARQLARRVQLFELLPEAPHVDSQLVRLVGA